MAVTVRFNTIRLEKKISAALAAANPDRLLRKYELAAAEANDRVENAIRDSGRGGDHNAEFAHQDQRVFRAGSGRFNISVGWLTPPASAAERGGGGKLWYQYQDSGFHLFGGSRWIDGVGATIDRRERLIEKIEQINQEHIGEIERALA